MKTDRTNEAYLEAGFDMTSVVARTVLNQLLKQSEKDFLKREVFTSGIKNIFAPMGENYEN